MTNEFRGSGLHGILIAAIDGVKRHPDAIRSVPSEPRCRLYYVHLMGRGLNPCFREDHHRMPDEMRAIYRVGCVEDTADRPDEFEGNRGSSYHSADRSWRTSWGRDGWSPGVT